MGTPDEIAQLRSDLVALMAQARELAGRIDALEAARVEEALPQEVTTEAVAEPVLVAKQEAPPEPQPDLPPLRDKGPEWVAAPPPLPPTATRRPSFIEAASPKPPQPKPAPAPAAPGWTLGDALKKAYRALGPKEEMTWEMALGTYWLPRVAVLLLAVGVVWALTLAVQRWGQEWMPYLRIGTGYAIAAGLFFGGRFIEHRKRAGAEQSFTDYARVMMAGGMALFYFVTFATHYVPYTRVFDQPYVTLALLTAIITAWGVVAEWRRSETLAFTVTLLGHFTVGLSTLTLPDPPGAAVAGLLLLNLGAGYFFARHGWQAVGLAGVLGGYTNYTLWLANSTPSESLWALAGGMAVLAAYWTIFAVAEYIASGRDDVQPSYRVRSAYLGINSGSLVLLGVGLIEGFDAAQPYRFAFLFTAAAVFLAFGLLYRRTRPGDILYGTYLTKASAVFALGLADYFEGSALTLSLAVEAVVLLYSAKRSGLVAPRALAMLVFTVAAGQGIAHGLEAPRVPYFTPLNLTALASPIAALLALMYFQIFHERTTWPVLTTVSPKISHKALHRLSLAAPPEHRDAKGNPVALPNPFPMNTLFAVSASLFLLCAILALVNPYQYMAATSLGALFFVVIALCTRTLGAMKAATLLATFAVVWWQLELSGLTEQTWISPGLLDASVVAGIGLLIISEALRIGKTWNAGPKWLFDSSRFVWAVLGSLMLSWMLPEYREVRHAEPIFLFTLACGFSLYAALLSSSSIGLASFVPFLLGILYFILPPSFEVALLSILGALLAAGICAVMVESKWWGERLGLRYHQGLAGPYVLYGGLALMVAKAAMEYWPPMRGSDTYAPVALGACAVVLSLPLHARALTVVATGYFGFACLWWLLISKSSWDGIFVRECWVAAIAAVVGGRFLSLRGAFPYRIPESLLLVCAFAIMTYYLNYISPRDWSHARELMLAVCFLIYGAALRLHVAGIISLLTGILVTTLLLPDAYAGLSVDGRVAGLCAAVLYWFLVERMYSIAHQRKLLGDNLLHIPIHAPLIAIPVILLLITLERVPVLSSFYLTIAWTLAAVGVMGVALLTRERYYRYAALCMFTLALGRVMLVDTRQLDGMYRILAVLFLGVVLLAVGYGYIKARERSTPKPPRGRIEFAPGNANLPIGANALRAASSLLPVPVPAFRLASPRPAVRRASPPTHPAR